MEVRAACAHPFYAGASPAAIEAFLRGFTPPELPGVPVGGVVPHAGWTFSGKTAARVFATLKTGGAKPSTFVFLGALHRYPVDRPALYPAGAWETPFGDLPVNESLARELVEAGVGLEVDPAPHRSEHSIEVSLPFIRYFFPDADFVPIVCPPRADSAAFGAALGAVLRDRPVVVLASTDLTHYGEGYGFAPAGSEAAAALRFVSGNDGRIIRLVEGLDASAIVDEAKSRMNACGSGALAAAVAAAGAMGARRGILVEYTTSYDVCPEDPVFRMVGYAGMVLV